MWGNGNLGYELSEKLWTPFYNGQIQALKFAQRFRDKQAQKREQNANLASKRVGELAKWQRTLCQFKGGLGQQRMDLSPFFISSFMFVKGSEISPFPERFFFSPRSGNPTKHKLDFKGTCLACSGHHEMRVQRWHPKGKESLEDADHWSREKGNAQESTNTPQKGTGTRNLLDFSWKIPQASPAASELKWLRKKKKKKSGKGASQRDLLEKKEGKEKWLNPILLILKANSSCLS